MRTTLQDLANSRAPSVLGLCSGDLPRLASYANEAQQVLINAAGETGFNGGWAKVLFQLTCDQPYITLPPQFARLINITLCRWGMPLFNVFYEVMEAGIGLQDPCTGKYGCGISAAFERDNVSTMVDMPSSGHYVRLYLTDSRDINKRVIFTGARDSNNVGIYTTDIANQIDGFFLTLDQPFVTTPYIVTSFSGVQKDVTYGDVLLFAVNAVSGVETQLARYTPNETRPSYRRYYLQGGCPIPANSPTGTARHVTALAKYEFQPVSQPSDYLLIGCIPALKAQMESIRFSEMDNPQSQAMALLKHRQAMKLLNQEMQHYHSDKVSVNFAPFGTARLERQMIGQLL